MNAPTQRSRLLVGISNPATMPLLVDLAVRLGQSAGCEIILTHVVRVPRQIGLASARSSPDVVAGRQLLQDALNRAQDAGIVAKAVVEVGREVHMGLVAAARSREAGLVMVGYSEPPSEADEASERRFDRITHRVGLELDADLVIGKFRGDSSDRILVPVEPDSDLTLIGLLVGAFTKDRPQAVRFLHVSADGGGSEDNETVRERLAESGLTDVGELESVTGSDIAEAVLARDQDYDMILLETTSAPASAGSLRGAVAEKIADRARCTTLLVRAGHPR